MRITLPFKITVMAVVVMTIGVGGVSYFGYRDAAGLLQDQSLIDVSDDVERETEIFAQTLTKAREDVLFLAESPPILGLVRAIQGEGYDDQQNMTDQMWRRRLEGLLSTILRQRKLYDKIRFIGFADKGKEIVRVDRHSGDIRVIPSAELQPKMQRPYLQDLYKTKLGVPFFSKTNLNYEYGKPTLPLMTTLRVGIPITSKSGQRFGAVIININFNILTQELFAQAPVNSHFFIASDQGEYLYHANTEKISTLNSNGTGPGTNLRDDFPKINFTDGHHSKDKSQGVTTGQSVLKRTKGRGLAFQHLHFSSKGQNQYFILGAVVSHIDINAKATAFGERLITRVMIAVLILGIIILIFTKFITRPIHRLTEIADKISQGTKIIAFPAFDRDEIGSLGRSMKAMYQHMEDARYDLQEIAETQEAMVKKRTQQLAEEVIERMQAEETVKASLKEKEVLLQEIHHRVKNNLQVVSSLLSLQAGSEPDQNIVAALNESERRVRVMARVHENLYRATDLAHINARDYLNAIAKDAKFSHGDVGAGIVIIEDIDDIILDVEHAIPIGQVVSELISNSFKYAFPNHQKGEVKISLKDIGNTTFELSVSDNGMGLPKGFVLEKSDTLGLKLVTALCGNLHGEITVNSENGTRIGIRFSGGRVNP